MIICCCCRGEPHFEIGEDGSDVFLKAHVNHPVSLIQSQVAADVQTHHLLLKQIHQSARGSDHHVDTTIINSGYRFRWKTNSKMYCLYF